MPDFSPKTLSVWLFFVLIAAYSLFQARFLILGPLITIDTPHQDEHVGSVVTVSGRAQHISFLSLDDRQIYTDKDGYFSEVWIAPPGTGIIDVRARDRFGREKEIRVRIVN